jgi:hypothetical protein
MPAASMWKKKGNAGAHIFPAAHAGQINTAFTETCERDLSHLVSSNL